MLSTIGFSLLPGLLMGWSPNIFTNNDVVALIKGGPTFLACVWKSVGVSFCCQNDAWFFVWQEVGMPNVLQAGQIHGRRGELPCPRCQECSC